MCLVSPTIPLSLAFVCAMLFADESARGRANVPSVSSFCLPASPPEKMATDVFFRHSSTIKEALVAFLMRHVNFIKCGAEESQREQLRLWKA